MDALRGKARSRDAPKEILYPEDIEGFLASLAAKGRETGTIAKYRRDLLSLYAFLPPGKRLEPEVLERWREVQLEDGYVPRTVNTRVSAANRLFDYIGRRDLQAEPLRLNVPEVQPELTRTEYLRLLQTAKLLKKEKPYLLVKVFGSVGVSVQELPKVTVEAARAGKLTLEGRRMSIPSCLREELLDYAGRERLTRGPIFVTRSGRPLNRSSVTESVRRLCRDAQVDEAKGNPRCLRKLYLTTMSNIQTQLALLAEQTYERLLETEHVAVGWDGQENLI